HLIITVPVNSTNQIYFNAHRAFTRNYVLEMFAQCQLVSESYVYGKQLYQKYQPQKGFGTGLYHFKKKK
ncbi:MAG TPA: hypothetical protein VF209_00165, partial [Patescibacteria group bacterium]